jgi:hypothetical protein
MTAVTKRAKPARRPMWVRVMRLVDPSTGEEVGAFIPAHHSDASEMRARQLRVGDVLRADFKKRRNPMFFRLAHALARHVAENNDGFEVEVAAEDWHKVLKRLQREAGICCEEQEIELPGFGKLVVKVAESLSFDTMDEIEFDRVFRGLADHICRTYWPQSTPEAIEEQARMIVGSA